MISFYHKHCRSSIKTFYAVNVPHIKSLQMAFPRYSQGLLHLAVKLVAGLAPARLVPCSAHNIRGQTYRLPPYYQLPYKLFLKIFTISSCYGILYPPSRIIVLSSSPSSMSSSAPSSDQVICL